MTTVWKGLYSVQINFTKTKCAKSPGAEQIHLIEHTENDVISVLSIILYLQGFIFTLSDFLFHASFFMW